MGRRNKPLLFEYLCLAYEGHKDELTAQQLFYFLRGVLYQWCVEHGESVMDMEDLFIPDIRYMTDQFKVKGRLS
jgi:hypothetical protein